MSRYDVVDGLYLLKQRAEGKGVDHYGIGVGGIHAWKLGTGHAGSIVVELVPPTVLVSRWGPSRRWEVQERIEDEGGALRRLAVACQQPRYDLLANNCEHFARYVAFGIRESRQLQNVVVLAAGAALTIWALRSRS